MTNLFNQHEQAVAHFQSGNYQQAASICQNILKSVPNQPETLYLLALIYKNSNNAVEAEKCFLNSIAANEKLPMVRLNFALFLNQANRSNEALIQFDTAHQLAPTNLDVLYNWSLSLIQLAQYDKALEVIKKAIKISDKIAQFYHAKGSAHKHLKQYNLAIAAFEKAISIDENNFYSWHDLGITYRIIGQPEKAINCYDRIKAQGDQFPEFHLNSGCAYYDNGQLELAETSLKKAIKLRPDYVLAHETINNLYWEQSKNSDFLTSYSTYIKSNAAPSPTMHFSYAAQLILAKDFEQAKDVLNQGIKIFGPQAQLCHALASVYIRQNINQSDAESLIAGAIKQESSNVRFRIDMANIFIKQQNYSDALTHLEIAGNFAPNNQEVWAYKGICWRLLKDEREHWLNNYQQFIAIKPIKAPSHYDNNEHFFDELKTFLTQLHKTNKRPLDQSVVGGSQTSGDLSLNSAPIIQELRAAININAKAYIESLPFDPSHPLLSKTNNSFVAQGLWSVLLNNKGFHTNHIHPEGWISGPTYIDVPEHFNAEDPTKAGWIKFGETSLDLDNREHIGFEYCPKQADCVFFPSYMWHGTYPTNTNDTRITVSGDIQPNL